MRRLQAAPPAKSWWESKTVWVNAITLATALMATALDHTWVADNPTLAQVVMYLVTGLNIALRFITAAPIRFAKR